MTSQQLELLFKYGLFTGYSYFLQAPPATATLTQNIADSGGSSALFGKLCSCCIRWGGAGVHPLRAQETLSERGMVVVKETPVGRMARARIVKIPILIPLRTVKKVEGRGGAIQHLSGLRALGAIPFAPITAPISSPAASKILESALTPKIETRLSNYLDQ